MTSDQIRKAALQAEAAIAAFLAQAESNLWDEEIRTLNDALGIVRQRTTSSRQGRY